MSAPVIRKIVRHAERHGAFGAAKGVVGWAAAVVVDPLAGQSRPDLSSLILLGERLGDILCREALAVMAINPEDCRSYGKGAIVGMGSDLEHGAAILHPRFGAPVRAILGRGKAIIPSTLKQAGPGARLDVPLHGIDNEWDFASIGAIEIGAADAPGTGEILIALALAVAARSAARIGVEP